MPELPKNSPDFENLDLSEPDGEVLSETEGNPEGEKLIGYGLDLASPGYGTPPKIQEQLRSYLEADDDLAEAVGKIRFNPPYFLSTAMEEWGGYKDSEDMAKGYFYYLLHEDKLSRIGDRIKHHVLIQDKLDVEPFSASTLRRIKNDGYLEDGWTYDAEERLRKIAETAVRDLHDSDVEVADLRDPEYPETVSDGEGVPPVQTIVRKLRSETFPYIRLKRDGSTEVSKDAALRVLVAAANGNSFINDAAKNLDLKPWYDGDEVPTGQTLIYHVRKSSREQITRMFMEANEPLFELADDHGYFKDSAEVAIDITDWPFYGDKDADSYVRGTKPGRNYSRAWKYITLSLVGTDTPLTLLILPVRKKTNTPYYVRRLLRLAEQYFSIERVYLDAGREFYSEDTISTVNEFGVELVMQGVKHGSDIKRFLHGMAHLDMETNQMPYGVGDLDKDTYTALGQKSYKKTSRQKSEAENPWEDYVYFYTNADMDENGVDELAAGYRNRWGIETSYRVLKEEFLPKSASPDATVRTFYFNFAAHLYNLWTAANIRRADDLDEDLSDGKQFTAGRFMQAIEDDPYDLEIPTEPPDSRDVFDGLFL